LGLPPSRSDGDEIVAGRLIVLHLGLDHRSPHHPMGLDAGGERLYIRHGCGTCFAGIFSNH